MKKKYSYPIDLLIMLGWTIFTLISVLSSILSETFMRTALGILMVLFIPGYVLIATLFPKKIDLDGIERIALSFCLSIFVVPLLGLLLNFILGIRLLPILITLCIYTVTLIIIAAVRREKLPEEDSFSVPFHKVIDIINDKFNTSRSKTDMILTGKQ